MMPKENNNQLDLLIEEKSILPEDVFLLIKDYIKIDNKHHDSLIHSIIRNDFAQ